LSAALAERFSLRKIPAAMLLTAMAGSAAAQSDADLVELGPIRVTSAAGFEQKITEAPASISVITQEALQQKRYTDLARALEDVEGIDARQGTGKTGGLNISVRGLPSEYTLILIDGRRQNPAGNIAPNGFNDSTSSFIPPLSAIERIEVIRGPMSTLYGSEAMGGVINIITKKVTESWSTAISLDHTFQENRDYGEATKTSFYSSGPLIEGILGLAVEGSLYDREASDLMFDDDSEVSKRGASPVEGRNYNLGAKLSWTPSEQHDFTLELDRYRQVYNNDECQLGTLDGRDRNCRPAPLTINGYADEQRFERDQVALTHTGRYSFGIVDSSLTHTTTETIGRTIPGTPPGASYIGYPSIIIGADRELESKDFVFDTQLVSEIGDNHLLSVGGQYWDAEMTDGVATETFEQTSWALFVEDEWRLLDQLALTIGARYEDHDAFGGHVSPRAYLVWNATQHWTFKGGVSRGYKTPTLNQLHDGINGVTGQGSTITIGSPDLDPEVTTNTEFGIYYDNLDNFSANATVFHNKFKDKIDTGPALPNCFYTADPNRPGCVSFGSGFVQESFAQEINIGKAETQGLELATSWRFAPGWRIGMNYTYTDSEQLSGINKGAPLTNTPLHMVNATLSWDATDRLALWLKGEYRSDRSRFTDRYSNLTADDRAVQDQLGDLKAYEVFHLGGTFKVSDNVNLNATIYNLFDKNFLDGEYYRDGSGNLAWASHYAHIGRAATGTIEEGRRLWISVNMTF
ncbi:MAG: TonB-dependent receptor, partial [Spongiibacteraceae bacterium]|nr:TonB-dependent receptor [Spongiibacteraceae bacterium]